MGGWTCIADIAGFPRRSGRLGCGRYRSGRARNRALGGERAIPTAIDSRHAASATAGAPPRLGPLGVVTVNGSERFAIALPAIGHAFSADRAHGISRARPRIGSRAPQRAHISRSCHRTPTHYRAPKSAAPVRRDLGSGPTEARSPGQPRACVRGNLGPRPLNDPGSL